MAKKIAAVVAAPVVNFYTCENFLRDLNQSAERIQRELNDWMVKKFQVSPAYALSWSAGVFEQAAELEVIKNVLAWEERRQENLAAQKDPPDFKTWLIEVERELTEQAMREVRWPSRSTSQQSNEMERSRAQANYNMARRAGDFARRMEG